VNVTSGASAPEPERFDVASPAAYVNRELSWLGFAARVIAQIERGHKKLSLDGRTPRCPPGAEPEAS